MFWGWVKQPGQRARLDGLVLRLPIVGPTARKFSVAQAARTLATLLGGGIPLVSALEVSARSIGNQHMARELASTEQQVREGRALAVAMADRGAFPDVAIKMVEVGESTGALQEMLTSLADFYDEEIETGLARFVTIIEPALLVIMGLVIAGCCCRSTCRSSSSRRCWGGSPRRTETMEHSTDRTDAAGVPAGPVADLYVEGRRGDAGRPRGRGRGRRGGWPSGTGWTSSTCRSSGSTRRCSARSRPT